MYQPPRGGPISSMMLPPRLNAMASVGPSVTKPGGVAGIEPRLGKVQTLQPIAGTIKRTLQSIRSTKPAPLAQSSRPLEHNVPAEDLSAQAHGAEGVAQSLTGLEKSTMPGSASAAGPSAGAVASTASNAAPTVGVSGPGLQTPTATKLQPRRSLRRLDRYNPLECETPAPLSGRVSGSGERPASPSDIMTVESTIPGMQRDDLAYCYDIGMRRRRSSRHFGGHGDDLESGATVSSNRSSTGNASASSSTVDPEDVVVKPVVKRSRRSSMSELSASLSQMGLEDFKKYGPAPSSHFERSRLAEMEKRHRLRGVPSPASILKQRREKTLRDTMKRVREMQEEAAREAEDRIEQEWLDQVRQEEEAQRAKEEEERMALERERLQREIEEREAELARAREALARLADQVTAKSNMKQQAESSHHHSTQPQVPPTPAQSSASSSSFSFTARTPRAYASVNPRSASQDQSQNTTRTPARQRREQQKPEASSYSADVAEETTHSQPQQSTEESQAQKPRREIKIPMADRMMSRKRQATSDAGAGAGADSSTAAPQPVHPEQPPSTPKHTRKSSGGAASRSSSRATAASEASSSFDSVNIPSTPVRGQHTVFEHVMTARKNTVTRKRYQSAISPETQQRRKREEEERQERELQARVAQRYDELRAKNANAKAEEEQRNRLREHLQPRLLRMTARMTPVELLNEFYPRCRLGTQPDLDTLRRNMRRAMAQYHPDKTVGLPLAQQVESEIVFTILHNAYEKLEAACGY